MPTSFADGTLLIPENPFDATEEILTPEDAAMHTMRAQWFVELLKGIDERLTLIFVKPGSTSFPHSPRFYIVRNNEMVAPTYWVVQGEDGGYCEPTMAHFERFRSFDTATNPDLWRRFELQRDSRRRRAEKRKNELREEFREKLLERLNHIFDPATMLVTAGDKEKLDA